MSVVKRIGQSADLALSIFECQGIMYLQQLLLDKKNLITEKNRLNSSGGYRHTAVGKIHISSIDKKCFSIDERIQSVERTMFMRRLYSDLVPIYNFWINIGAGESGSPEGICKTVHQFLRTSQNQPVNLLDGRWIYREYLYSVQGAFSNEQFRLLILEDFDKERRYFERLKQKFDKPVKGDKFLRPRIPEQVRVEVWRRDSGKCARCDSRENLEYDHIVPVSRGGSNTARNIELLCEACNRSKGANIV